MSKELRVYMATQANKTVGVRLDLQTKVAKRFDITSDTTTTRMSALQALVGELESIDFEDQEVPVQLFINDHMVKNINNGYYKHWLLVGATSDGEVIADSELELWEKFHNIYSVNNIYIIIKSTSDARLAESLKAMDGKTSKKTGKIVKISVTSKQNDKYSTFCWDKVKSLVGEIDDIDDSNLA